METYAHIEFAGYSQPADKEPYMDGYEGSDLMAVYFALDHLNEVEEERLVEIIGDGGAIQMLSGTGKVAAKWGGRTGLPNWWGGFGNEKRREVGSHIASYPPSSTPREATRSSSCTGTKSSGGHIAPTGQSPSHQ
jgi:hypothetical protein